MFHNIKKKHKEELELNNLQSEIDNCDDEITNMLGNYLTDVNSEDYDISTDEQDHNTSYKNLDIDNNTSGDIDNIVPNNRLKKIKSIHHSNISNLEENNITDKTNSTVPSEEIELKSESNFTNEDDIDSDSEERPGRNIVNMALAFVLGISAVSVLYISVNNYLEYKKLVEDSDSSVTVNTPIETTLVTSSTESTGDVIEGEQYVEYDELPSGGREELKLKDPPFEITDEAEKVIKESISLLKEALECDKFIANNTLSLDEDKLNTFKEMYSKYNANLTSFSSSDLENKPYKEYASTIIEMLEVYDSYFVTMIEFSGNSASKEEYSSKISNEISRISDELGDKSWIFTEYSDIFYFYKLYE